jgi:hypothetical protein
VAPWIELGGTDAVGSTRVSVAARPPPGVGFFEQAMSLFKTPFEDATIDHVEILNLMAFYSYSLGRRKSAYVYSGLAIRVASSLMLHTPTAYSTPSPRDSEHRKRLWWTTYQLDAMTGSELGLNSTYNFSEIEEKLGLPSDDGLSQEKDEFAPCAILTAHMHLCSVRSIILSVTSTTMPDIDLNRFEAILESPISELKK